MVQFKIKKVNNIIVKHISLYDKKNDILKRIFKILFKIK